MKTEFSQYPFSVEMIPLWSMSFAIKTQEELVENSWTERNIRMRQTANTILKKTSS